MIAKYTLLMLAATTLGGCLARTAYDVGTAPVRATSKVVDWTTTSRSEADRNRGRRARKDCKKEREEARREARAAGVAMQPPSPLCR